MPEKLPARVLETCLYVADIERACRFYERVFGFEVMVRDNRFCSFDADGHVLLLFLNGASSQDNLLPWGTIPAHDGSGRSHIGFAVPADSLEAWRERLKQEGIAVESEFVWPAGGTSIYFRDPDGHLLELLTPGVWRNY